MARNMVSLYPLSLRYHDHHSPNGFAWEDKAASLARADSASVAVVIPSGNLLHSHGTWPFIVDLPMKNVLFHSYVSLSDGMFELQQRKG